MTSSELASCNARFGDIRALSFSESDSGLVIVHVNTPLGRARVLLQGAQLLDWRPTGQSDVVWLSPLAQIAAGKSPRGGVPICWPWFGAHPSRADLPAHGFARSSPWELASAGVEDDQVQLTFCLLPVPDVSGVWPYRVSLEVSFTFGASLSIELRTRNSGGEPVQISEALHTYFAVGDVHDVRIEGLDGCTYIDKADGGLRKQQSGLVTFDGETDRAYLNTSRTCLLLDDGLKRKITIEKQGSRSTIVWNPGIEKSRQMPDLGESAYPGMVCIESGNVVDDQITLGPVEEHTLWVRYASSL